MTRDDVVWTYSGVRPLYDDGAASATAATRDYVLSLDDNGPPILSVFGGKITTHRVLAYQVVEKLDGAFGDLGETWTEKAPLPGGDFPVDGVGDLVDALKADHPFLDDRAALRLVRAYGTNARQILDGAQTPEVLGQDFGAGLTAREVEWLMDHEYACTAEDVVWRRSKLGLRMSRDEVATLDQWMTARRA